MYNQINQLDIIYLLDKLWIKYQSLWNGSIWLIEDWKLTDGWRGNIRDNYIHDFSWKWRTSGPPFAFIKKHLNLSTNETFKRFETNFNIKDKDELKRPKNKWSPRQKKNMSTSSYSRKRLNDL